MEDTGEVCRVSGSVFAETLLEVAARRGGPEEVGDAVDCCELMIPDCNRLDSDLEPISPLTSAVST